MNQQVLDQLQTDLRDVRVRLAYLETIEQLLGNDIALLASGAEHLHGLARWAAPGVVTVFELPDVAEYVEVVTVAGDVQDATLYTLSADRTQITFDAAPTAAQVVQANYVIARL